MTSREARVAVTKTFGRLSRRPRPVLAQLVPVIAAVLQWTLWKFVSPLLWLFFFPAVFLSAWIGGLAGGLVSTVTSVVIVLYVFSPPQFSVHVQSPKDILSAMVFLLMGAVISIAHHRLRK